MDKLHPPEEISRPRTQLHPREVISGPRTRAAAIAWRSAASSAHYCTRLPGVAAAGAAGGWGTRGQCGRHRRRPPSGEGVGAAGQSGTYNSSPTPPGGVLPLFQPRHPPGRLGNQPTGGGGGLPFANAHQSLQFVNRRDTICEIVEKVAKRTKVAFKWPKWAKVVNKSGK